MQGHVGPHPYVAFFIALAWLVATEMPMAATDQQIADEARDSLLRILQSDTANWSDADKRQQQLEIDRLENIITKFEAKAQRAGGRRIFQPVRRVNI